MKGDNNMITRLIITTFILVVTLASCRKELYKSTDTCSVMPCVVVATDGNKPLEVFSALSGMTVQPTDGYYSYSYRSDDGTFYISVDGCYVPDDDHTYATMLLRMPGDETGKTILFVTPSYPASRSESGDVPVKMEY